MRDGWHERRPGGREVRDDWWLVYKPKWRFVGSVAHCFVRKPAGGHAGYASLCGRHERRQAGGATVERPDVGLRCGRCDAEEAKLAGAAASLPESRAR
jgi:hypothetical protein